MACANCGTHYLRPRLSERILLQQYQQDSYFGEASEFGYRDYTQQQASLRKTFRVFAHRLAHRGILRGRLLEIGCARGHFIAEARRYCDYAAGVELSESAGTLARKVGDQIYRGTLDDVPVSEKFDTICAFHVLEHVYKPVEFIAEIRRRLRSGGHLLIAVPDYGSWWRHLLGSRWPSFKIPEHVTFFDRKSCSRLLGQAGFANPGKIRCVYRFPLGQLLNFVSVPVPARLQSIPIPVPATTLALYARHE
ncbi:MAG: class I SAM-dependent methyltransferase [Xanthomonadales bacterium]|nr:class I SAM-dependent methyltransferase [Xanthomonadales bacterium]